MIEVMVMMTNDDDDDEYFNDHTDDDGNLHAAQKIIDFNHLTSR